MRDGARVENERAIVTVEQLQDWRRIAHPGGTPIGDPALEAMQKAFAEAVAK